MYRTCVFWLFPIFIVVLLAAGCSRTEVRSSEIIIQDFGIPSGQRPRMAILPLATTDHDETNAVRLAQAFSRVWARETDGSNFPVIPRTGLPGNPIRVSADQYAKTGWLSPDTVSRYTEQAFDFVLVLWIKEYGLTWQGKDQNKNVALGYSIILLDSEEVVMEGHGEAAAAGRRTPFSQVEEAVLTELVFNVARNFGFAEDTE